ncbi:Ras family [Pelomyxa schiedti]|nr:Ras family [Pelomyxa schiedti]
MTQLMIAMSALHSNYIVDGVESEVRVFDTTKHMVYYKQLRDPSIWASQAFIVMYSITDERSFNEMQDDFSDIIRIKGSNSADIPVIILGHKSDLESSRVIATDRGQKLASKWGKYGTFMEASAKDNINVDEVFTNLLRTELWEVSGMDVAARSKVEAALRGAYHKVKASLAGSVGGWANLVDNQGAAAALSVWSRSVSESRVAQFKVVGQVPCLTPAEVVSRVLVDGERRGEWNPLHDNTVVLDTWRGAPPSQDCGTGAATAEQQQADYSVFVERHKPALGGFVSPRDFFKASVKFYTHGDTSSSSTSTSTSTTTSASTEGATTGQEEHWFIYTSLDSVLSDNMPAQAKPAKSHTRAIAFPSGTVGFPREGGGSLLHMIIHADPCGWIPSWAVNQAVSGEVTNFFNGVISTFS